MVTISVIFTILRKKINIANAITVALPTLEGFICLIAIFAFFPLGNGINASATFLNVVFKIYYLEVEFADAFYWFSYLASMTTGIVVAVVYMNYIHTNKPNFGGQCIFCRGSCTVYMVTNI